MTDPIVNKRKSIFLGIICLVIFAGIIVAGLWPFKFWPENKVEWLKDQNGVRFYGQGIIYSEKEIAMAPSFRSSNLPSPISVEICLQPETEASSHIGRILSFFDGQGSESFFIGQWRPHLILGKGIHGKDTYREIGIRDVLKKAEKRFVAITSGVDGTRIYVDGILLKSSPRFHLFPINEKPSGKIALGASPTGSEYWTGNILSLAIYDRVLTGQEVSTHSHGSKKSGEEGLVALYPFDERCGQWGYNHASRRHLFIPSKFEVLQKTILVPPWVDFRFNRSYLMDILTNILGFIPFGFFFSAYLSRKKIMSKRCLFLMAILLGGSLSLCIEVIQVYLPTRNSQLMDVLANSMGAILGATLYYLRGHQSSSL